MQKSTIFFLISFFWCAKADAFGIGHDFFVKVGAFDASKTHFSYTLSPTDYEINSQIATNGFFDSVYPFKANYTTSGKTEQGKLISQAYGYTSKSRFNERAKQVFFDAAGEPLYQITSKNGKSKKRAFAKSPVPADTFDLQTVLAKLIRQYNDLGFCDSKLSVYDGKRRFDVIFKDEGNEELSPNEHSFFSGSAARCSMHIAKLLNEDDDTLWEFSANKPVYFWIARDNKTSHPFVARIQIKNTPLGELNAYISKITVKE